MPGFWLRFVLGTMELSLFNAFAMGASPEDERATANSYAMVGRNVGSAAAAKLYGVLIASGSFAAPFTIAGVCAVATAAAAIWAFDRNTRPHTNGFSSH